ncbi:MAG TPA: tripartite tricarboxylate transporter substrate binding protein [Burkholderiales bacterium]|nr:tripartite tricarboxylate transporter substrate binding protein [Burkholderiales bacterium]
MIVIRLSKVVLLVLGVLSVAPHAVFAQAYPVKPIRFIAPFPPGGTTDLLARMVAQKLSDGLGRQVVVENRGGASGTIGHELAAKAPADGYTLVLTSMGGLVTNRFLYKRLPFDPDNDFAPISMLATAGQVLVVHSTVPARNVKELVALAKARPGQLNVGSGGLGTTQHIVGEVFQQATGTKFVHVPYKGGGLAVTDLVGGQIDLAFADMAPAVPHVKSGRLRALAVSSEQRAPVLPDVPTMGESGIKQWFPQTWWAIAAPKGTPSAIISRINAEVAQAMKTGEVQEKLANVGLFALHSPPERVTELVKTGMERMARVVKAAGIQPE